MMMVLLRNLYIPKLVLTGNMCINWNGCEVQVKIEERYKAFCFILIGSL